MAKFNLDNYETVEERLKVFWKENPKARIHTEIVHMTDDGTCVTVKAEIYKMEVDARPVTTGLAQETKGQGGFANTDAWVENCETSAIGRALANWNYQGSKAPRPSREEMSKVQPKPKLTEQKEDTKVLEKAKDDFVKDIEKDMKYRLQKALEFHESNKVLRDKFKQEAWEEFTIDGPKDLQVWTNDHLDVFLDLFVAKQSQTDDKDIKDLVDDVFPDSSIDRGCPKCGVAEWIEDNRAKKAEAPEGSGLKNIPDFSCSQYMQNDGCGWGGYIGGKGDREVPSEWL